jgi:lipopolysaccharide transport system permease protein
MLALYTFVFSYVFQARWGKGEELPRDMYALILYTGMILHAQLAECLNRTPGLMQNNSNYVKKVKFPLESLIWVIVGSDVSGWYWICFACNSESNYNSQYIT